MASIGKKLLIIIILAAVAIVIGLILWLALGWLDTFLLIVWLVIGTLIIGLIIMLATWGIASKQKATDRLVMIFLLALILVLVLPYIMWGVELVLSFLGDIFAGLRSLIDGGGVNYLVLLTPVVAFLIVFVLTKYFIDIAWDKAVWVTLLTLFILFIIYYHEFI